MNSLEILLIEDDAIEVMKLERTIISLQLDHKLIKAFNGEDALKTLEQIDRLPDIILLDLNMPKISGLEFLSILKDNKSFKHIPIIVLTTSNNSLDLLECYKIGIAGYILKPLKYEDYVLKIKNLLSYWSINELIRRNRSI